jgi:hypothetical protein
MARTYPIPPSFHGAQAQKRYHWDIDQSNDSDVTYKAKFRGNWQAELDLFQPREFDVDLSQPQNSLQWEEWLRLGYNINSWSRKMAVDPTKMPKIHQCYTHMAFHSPYQCWLTEQKPMQHVPLHVDYPHISGIPQSIMDKHGWRILVFLSDWWPGEFVICGTEIYSHWQAGWVLAFPICKYPHATANMSHHSGFRLRTAGLITPALREWLAADSVIDIH